MRSLLLTSSALLLCASHVAPSATCRPPMLAATTRLLRGPLLARPHPPPTSLAGAASSSILPAFFARTSVFKSPAVQQWLGDRAIDSPVEWRPWKWDGKWQPPMIGRKRQQLLVKEAIRRGDIKLEPTVMVPPPKFKGRKEDHNRPIRRAEVAAKMAEMPKLIAEYMRDRREKRAKEKAANRWK